MTFFERFYERLQQVLDLDRQIQPVDEMLDKNIQNLPERYARYIRALLGLTEVLKHDHKLIEALANINKEQSDLRFERSDKLASIVHQILPVNAIVLTSTSPETLAQILAFCVREDNLIEDAFKLLGPREKLELKRIIDRLQ